MNLISSQFISRSPKQDGAILVEAAVLLPIMLMILLATIEIAAALSQYRTIVTQVQIAARYLSTKASGSGHSDAVCLVRYGNLPVSGTCSGSAILPGLLSATVQVEDSTTNSALRAIAVQSGSHTVRVNMVTVSVTGYQYHPIIGKFLTGILSDQETINFNTVRSTRRQIL
jgi:Flp pilus assembly protein TadG